MKIAQVTPIELTLKVESLAELGVFYNLLREAYSKSPRESEVELLAKQMLKTMRSVSSNE